jgi:AcrR family transcriptional regulator
LSVCQDLAVVNTKEENESREEAIIEAAIRLILRQGYDKTSMSDIAQEVGLSRGILYLHFENKETLFKALIETEIWEYAQLWFQSIENDPRGGTVGGLYRAVLYAIRQRPLMSAIIKRDKRVFGNYLRRADNIFATMQKSAVGDTLLRQLQEAGAIRADVDTRLYSYIMDLMSFGLLNVNVDEISPSENQPAFEDVMEVLAEMLDKVLSPENGDLEAGKAVIRAFAANAAQNFEAIAKRKNS